MGRPIAAEGGVTIAAWRAVKERIFTLICIGATLFGVFALACLFYQIATQGWHRIDWEFITNMPSRRPERAGIYPAVIGTLWLIGLTALVTVPIGVGAALYLEEFAPKGRITRFIQVNIANLAGVPSIVYGLLGLSLFVRALHLGQSLAAASLTMSLLILPLVITASREALSAVPSRFREGSLALGATHWETVRHAVLPSATSGIITGVLLGISRAIGEAAPMIAVGAAVFVSSVPKSPFEPGFTVMPIQIFNWADRSKKGFLDNAAAAILVLFAILIAFNLVAIYFRARARKRTRG
jgi:phosphate transport system permease protein